MAPCTAAERPVRGLPGPASRAAHFLGQGIEMEMEEQRAQQAEQLHLLLGA